MLISSCSTAASWDTAGKKEGGRKKKRFWRSKEERLLPLCSGHKKSELGCWGSCLPPFLTNRSIKLPSCSCHGTKIVFILRGHEELFNCFPAGGRRSSALQ